MSPTFEGPISCKFDMVVCFLVDILACVGEGAMSHTAPHHTPRKTTIIMLSRREYQRSQWPSRDKWEMGSLTFQLKVINFNLSKNLHWKYYWRKLWCQAVLRKRWQMPHPIPGEPRMTCLLLNTASPRRDNEIGHLNCSSLSAVICLRPSRAHRQLRLTHRSPFFYLFNKIIQFSHSVKCEILVWQTPLTGFHS